MKMWKYIFSTVLGEMAVGGSERGLRFLVLLGDNPSAALESVAPVLELPSPFESAAAKVINYLKGHQVDFSEPLDFSGASNFQEKVWQITRLIPYGETRSYGWIAAQVGKPNAYRAVGQALGSNPLPIIIPCHRVIAANGGLGGFGGGLKMKAFLLHLEARQNT